MSSALLAFLLVARQLAPVESAHPPRVPIEVNTLAATDPKLSAFEPAPPDPARVHYTQPSDVDNADEQPQVIWARGAQYKARFDADGATYYPIFGALTGASCGALGSRALQFGSPEYGERRAQHHPLALSPSTVTLGGEPLAFANDALGVRSHDRIAFDRGAFVETYDLTPGAIEQSFIFASLPSPGELVVTIPLDTDLSIAKKDDGVELAHELFRVTYSGAVAIDARGERHSLLMHVVDDAIELVVDAPFLARATFPLTLDPVISTFTVNGTTNREFRRPDIAYDPDTHTWLVVYAELVNGEDDPIYVFYGDDPSAGPVSSGFIDLSTNSWLDTHCANNRAARQFLIVGDVQAGADLRVDGRWLPAPGSSAPSLLRTIGTPVSGLAGASVVGGDPRASGATPYCVSYSDRISATEFVVHAGILGTDGSYASGSPFTLGAEAHVAHLRSAISRSNGGAEWALAWDRAPTNLAPDQIWTARISTSGAITEAPHAIASVTGAESLGRAAMSSPMTGTRIHLAAWESFDGASRHEAKMRLLNPDPAAGGAFNTNIDVDGVASTLAPSVEYDGSKFQLVVIRANGLSDELGTVFDWTIIPGFSPSSTNDVTIVRNVEFEVGAGSNLRAWPRMACPVAAGADPSFLHRAAIVSLQYVSSAGFGVPSTVHGTVTESAAGAYHSLYCTGDGVFFGSCPCGNNGATGHGCANSVNPAGAKLDATGVNSMLSDTFVLQVTGVPQTTTCWFFQENLVDGIPAPFGDGLRCGAGPIVRLKTKAAVGGAVSYPAASEVPLSIRGSLPQLGALVAYQVSYRNAQNFCTPATINITNGVLAVWTP